MNNIPTYSGGYIDIFNLKSEDINIKDIAHGLSIAGRWSNQCNTKYSSAEHCLYVSQILPDEWKLAGLLHDASDFILPEVAHYLKHSKLMTGFRTLENEIQDKIYRKYGINYVDHALIKKADNTAAYWEYKKLFNKDLGHMDCVKEDVMCEVKINIYQAKVAEYKFIKQFERLKNE